MQLTQFGLLDQLLVQEQQTTFFTRQNKPHKLYQLYQELVLIENLDEISIHWHAPACLV